MPCYCVENCQKYHNKVVRIVGIVPGFKTLMFADGEYQFVLMVFLKGNKNAKKCELQFGI